MAYRHTEFERDDGVTVTLPFYNPSQEHSPSPGRPSLVASIGGYFDQYGTSDTETEAQNIPVAGVVWGETEYLEDEAGNIVVDEAGVAVTSGDAATVLHSKLSALSQSVKKRGKLWRIRMSDDVRQWKRARFQSMSQPQAVRDRDFMATVTCHFETAMTNWHAAAATTVSGNATDGTPLYLVVSNAGVTVDDAVLTVTCSSGTITSVALTCAALDVAWTWTGSLTTGQALVVDAGNQEVSENAVNAYSGFSLTGVASGVMPIETGTWVFVVTLTGGTGVVSLSFFVQVP